MSIAVPPRKGLLAKRIARERPNLKPAEIGKMIGVAPSYVREAKRTSRFGTDKVKSRRSMDAE